MTLTMTDEQSETITKMVPLGFKVTKFWTDGVIDTATVVNGVTVRVFVAKDGTVRPPRTEETMLVSASMHSAGLVVSTHKHP